MGSISDDRRGQHNPESSEAAGEEDYPPSTAVHRRVTDPTLRGTIVDMTGCTKDGSKPIRGQRMPGAGLN